MNQAVIGIGSNIQAVENVETAVQMLSEDHVLIDRSSFTWTEPVGYRDQPDFLNGAVLIATSLGRMNLKRYLRLVERKLLRVKTANKYGPRTIDLDIVVWNGCVIDRDFYTRDFVKEAVLQLMPELKECGEQERRSKT